MRWIDEWIEIAGSSPDLKTCVEACLKAAGCMVEVGPLISVYDWVDIALLAEDLPRDGRLVCLTRNADAWWLKK